MCIRDRYPVRVFLYKDEVMVTLDTSGDSLHKRGYRLATSKAQLTETLAASLIMLTPVSYTHLDVYKRQAVMTATKITG